LSLLLDENLSPRLIPRLTSLFPGLTHVRNVELRQAEDRAIWNWAKQNSYTVVTADADFVAMFNQAGPPPRLVPIERCDFPFRVIEELFRQNTIRISEFEKDPHSGLLILRPPPLKPAGNVA
jgi:predicted nuclease of predicted toxin-antitoxin system